jgi:hypothetical protein
MSKTPPKPYHGALMVHPPGTAIDLEAALKVHKSSFVAEFYRRNSKFYAVWMAVPGGVVFFREDAMEVDHETADRLGLNPATDIRSYADLTSDVVKIVDNLVAISRYHSVVEKEYRSAYMPPGMYEV